MTTWTLLLAALAVYLWIAGALLLRFFSLHTELEASRGWYWLLWPFLPQLAAGIWLFDRVKGLGR